MEKTISSIFIVPTLGINKESANSNGFINAFINDQNSIKKYEDCVFLLYRPKYFSRFRKFINDEYNRTRAIIDDYDYSNGFVVVVYRLNPKLGSDFQLIKQGKYSKTSIEFQDLFPKKVEIVKDNKKIEEVSLQYRIFKKTADLESYWKTKNFNTYMPGDEIWFDFKENAEILNESTLKNIIFNLFQTD